MFSVRYVGNFIKNTIQKGYDKITRTKFRKRIELIFEKKKKCKNTQTVFKVNCCFKVLFNLFIVIIKIKFISFFINLLIFL
jgi:phosphoribosylformylglycinamidine (FGAM) synthase PurS component